MLIRERRFDEVSSEVWDQVADKVEALAPKRRGRPSLQDERLRVVTPGLIDFNLVGPRKTAFDRFEEISARYYELVRQGEKKGKAKEKVANELGMSPKSIEAVLTALRKYSTSRPGHPE